MIPAVIYARFSSNAQREASSEQQINVCTAFARQNGYEILRVYSDHAMTGRTDQRPQFLRMIKDAHGGSFSFVLVYALDRFSRDKYDSARYKYELRQAGVRVISATEPISDSPSGILVESVFEGLAQYYSAELSQKIRRGYENNAQHCLATGSVPFGFRRSADGHYEIQPEEADVVREIFRRVAAGDLYADIYRDLNARGIRTRHGSAWGKSSFNSLLTNQRYIGTYISKYNIKEDAIPQIVDKDTFYKVQALLPNKARPRGPRRTPNGIYMLTGKLYCGLCSSAMTGTSGTSKSGKLCYYYTCQGHRAHRCDQRSYSRDQLESAVCRAIWDDVLSDDSIRWMAHQTYMDQQKLLPETDLGILRAQLQSVKNQKSNLMKAILAGIITDTTKEELLRLEREEADLSAQIRDTEQLLTDHLTEDDIISYLEIFRSGHEDQDFTRAGLLDAFVTRVEIHADHMQIYFSIKKEDRQKSADLPPALVCSFSADKWIPLDPKRTLYHLTCGDYMIKIAS